MISDKKAYIDQVLQQKEETQQIVEAAQAKELAANKVLDELENAKSQIEEMQAREKAMSSKDDKEFSVSFAQPDVLLQQIRKAPSHSQAVRLRNHKY